MTHALLFVYAVDGGLVADVLGALHKLVSPATYPCTLCALTHGPLRPRPAWSRAIAELGIDCQFLHRDELVERHGPDQPPLPVVFLVEGDARRVLLSAADIAGCRDLDALIALLSSRLAARRA